MMLMLVRIGMLMLLLLLQCRFSLGFARIAHHQAALTLGGAECVCVDDRKRPPDRWCRVRVTGRVARALRKRNRVKSVIETSNFTVFKENATRICSVKGDITCYRFNDCYCLYHSVSLDILYPALSFSLRLSLSLSLCLVFLISLTTTTTKTTTTAMSSTCAEGSRAPIRLDDARSRLMACAISDGSAAASCCADHWCCCCVCCCQCDWRCAAKSECAEAEAEGKDDEEEEDKDEEDDEGRNCDSSP